MARTAAVTAQQPAPGLRREAQQGAQERWLLNLAAAPLIGAGLLGILGGLWFALGDHPFYGEGGFAPDVQMTRAQVEAFNPKVAEWMLHISRQTGIMTLSWGVFMVLLAWFGLRRGDRLAWAALWLAGFTPLLLMGLGEAHLVEVFESGQAFLIFAHLLGVAAFLVVLFGLLLPARVLLRKRS